MNQWDRENDAKRDRNLQYGDSEEESDFEGSSQFQSHGLSSQKLRPTIRQQYLSQGIRGHAQPPSPHKNWKDVVLNQDPKAQYVDRAAFAQLASVIKKKIT